MKKLFIIVAVFLLSALLCLLAGCGDQTEQPAVSGAPTSESGNVTAPADAGATANTGETRATLTEAEWNAAFDVANFANVTVSSEWIGEDDPTAYPWKDVWYLAKPAVLFFWQESQEASYSYKYIVTEEEEWERRLDENAVFIGACLHWMDQYGVTYQSLIYNEENGRYEYVTSGFSCSLAFQDGKPAAVEAVIAGDGHYTLSLHDYGTTAFDMPERDGVRYLGSPDGHYIVMNGGEALTGALVLPASINGKSVCVIGSEAFADCKGLTSVTIPDSVTFIDGGAFSGCSGLTSVTIGNGVIFIAPYAFYGCTNIRTATMPTIAIGAIPKDNLETVTLTSGDSIGKDAFEDCTSLTSIVIPDSVTAVGYHAFHGCTNLHYTAYDNAWYLGNTQNPYVALMYATDESITSCAIHADTKVIAAGAFSCCEDLAEITIPNGVRSIGDYAFEGCALTAVIIPDSVTYIGEQAFESCERVTTLTIGGGVTSIGENAFYGCEGVTSVTIPDNVTNISVGAFGGCTGLTSITIGSGLASVEGNLFEDCENLQSITVADGNTVFHSAGNCLIATESKELIAGCKGSVIPADGSVTSIGAYAFFYCEGLTSVVIPDSVTSIGEWAFYHCSNLTSITIPDSVTSIDPFAFSFCTGLTSITYHGTMAQWNAISKESDWNNSTGNYTVHCTDGDIVKANS